jgi:hypothetical protein
MGCGYCLRFFFGWFVVNTCGKPLALLTQPKDFLFQILGNYVVRVAVSVLQRGTGRPCFARGINLPAFHIRDLTIQLYYQRRMRRGSHQARSP